MHVIISQARHDISQKYIKLLRHKWSSNASYYTYFFSDSPYYNSNLPQFSHCDCTTLEDANSHQV